MDAKDKKASDYYNLFIPPYTPSKTRPINKNVPRGLLFRELGYKQRQDGVSTEFQAAAEDKLVFKHFEELRCQLPGASRSTFLMVFSPDGKKVASTHGNHNVYVTDLTTGKNVNTLSGHPRTPWCIAFHPSSNQILASGCLGGQVRVWDLHGGSELWMADGQTVIASLAFHPTDRLLVIATYNELHFWDWSQPEPFTKCYTSNEKEKVRYVAFDPLGHKLITGISNAPHVQTQWDRVTANPPNQGTSSASTSHASQSHASMMPPDRERRITVCYRSLVEQYEQLVQRYFDLSRSRAIPTMDRGTDPMDLEAELSNATRARVLEIDRDRNRNRDRERDRDRDRDRSGDRERDRAGPSSQWRDSSSNTTGSNSSPSDIGSNQHIPISAFPNLFNSLLECTSSSEQELVTESTSVAAVTTPSPSTPAAPEQCQRSPTTTPEPPRSRAVSFDLPSGPGHIDSPAEEERPGRFRLAAREARSPSGDSNSSTRDVAVGPADNRVRVHMHTYQSVPVTRTDQAPQVPLSECSFGVTPTTEATGQRCLFSRLHSQAQPAAPESPEQGRRFFVSRRSAFQPRQPRLDQSPTSGQSNLQPPRVVASRYLFQRRASSASESRDRTEPEGEGTGVWRPASPLTPMQRARIDMTDVGVRYGIQLLSRHIDNMQRLCRARLEILQLQQIRRMWEDLQRQIRSLHVAVRESTIALTGNADTSPDGTRSPRTSPDESPVPGRGRPGQVGSEQAERREENAAYIPNVSHLLEMARISDTNPQATEAESADPATPGPSQQSSPAPFTVGHLKNMIRARYLKEGCRSVKEARKEADASQTHSTGLNNRDQLCPSTKVQQGPIKSCLKSSASSSSSSSLQSGRVTFSSDNDNIAWDTVEISSSNTAEGSNNAEENNAPTVTPTSAICTGNKPNVECNVERDSQSSTLPSDLQPQDGIATNTTEPSMSDGSGLMPTSGTRLASDSDTTNPQVPTTSASGRPSRGGFWLVSTMSLTQPVPTRHSTTSTAGSPAITTPSGSSSRTSGTSIPNVGYQLLLQQQQRLWRIRSKVYLRRPRLLALGPRSMRRHLSGSHSGSLRSITSNLLRDESGRRPWFLQSAVRPQRSTTSVNAGAQVGSSPNPELRDAAPLTRLGNNSHSSTQTDSPSQDEPQPSSSRLPGDSLPTTTKIEGKTETVLEGNVDLESSTSRVQNDTTEGATVSKHTGHSSAPCPPEDVNKRTQGKPNLTEARAPREDSGTSTRSDSASAATDRGNASQQEPSTSESLLAMIARLERLVQQQREQREFIRSNLFRERESSGQSRRTNMWGLRVRPSWLRSEINSGSDSDSNPESERLQSWGQASERLARALENEEGHQRERFRQNTTGSRRNRPSQLDHDWEWTRESTRLRARQVLSLMVESLTQFFEENGLSNNTPHAVLDEQIYNLYVLLQLALELTDLLLAQLVSTRRELEHQWVHRLRSPVALDASVASEENQARDRDREQRGSRGGRRDEDRPSFGRFYRHRFFPDVGGCERPERSSGRSRGDSTRRLGTRMNCFRGGIAAHMGVTHASGLRSGRGVANRSVTRELNSRGESPSTTAGRMPARASPGSSTSPRRTITSNPIGTGGIMVRVQQYPTTTTTTTPVTTSSPASTSAATSNSNTRSSSTPTAQHDAFTVPLVQVNDILIPDTSLLNQPRTRPQSPPPNMQNPQNPFILQAGEPRIHSSMWPDLWPYIPGSNWRPRYLHPRYVGPNFFSDDQEEQLPSYPLDSFNFIRGNSIVPETVIITDAPMSPNHRIQVWDFSKCNIPDISNAEKNVIVAECKIHNDASVDVSNDGRLLVTLLPSGRLSITTMLGVYSLQWESLGQCLYTTSFEQNAVSVSLSPASRHLLVGLASRRVALLPNDRHTMAQIFRLDGARPGCSVGGRGRLCHLRDIEQGREHGYMSLNCIRWAPGPGQGFVYGTNTGQLKVLR